MRFVAWERLLGIEDRSSQKGEGTVRDERNGALPHRRRTWPLRTFQPFSMQISIKVVTG